MEPCNKKILVIDDDDKIGAMLKVYFSKQGFAVETVQKAAEAEREIEKTKPDLIFLDYRMSPITGKDILERMKVRGDRTPVVMMSAYRRRDGDMEMMRLGALAYLPKPFDFAEVDRILRRVFP